MSHTPGPWIIEIDSVPVRGRGAQGKRIPTMVMVVAELGGMPGLIVSQGEIEPRDYANARLIAAAPDLLEVLKAAAQIIGHPDDSFSKLMAEVIAKAEGK